MPKEKFDDDHLDALTEEERAGLEDDDLLDDPEDGDEGDDDPAEQPTPADKPEPAEKPEKPADQPGDDADDDDDPQDPAEKPADQPADKPAPAEPEPEARAPTPPYKAPDNARDRVKAIDDELDAVAAKFDDGELTAREMREQERKLRDERENLSKELLKEEFSVEQAKAQWHGLVETFLDSNPAYREHVGRLTMLDYEVRRLQAETGNQFDPAHLRKAHATVQKSLGLADTPAPDPKTPTPKRPAPPPSLSGLPSADIEDTDEGARFAYLDRLKGVEFEDALAKLSDADRDAYLAS